MIIPFTALTKLRATHRRRKIVFVRGSFDLVHIGHVDFLRRAKKHGDILVVALARDTDLRRRKGADRPILPLAQRKRVVDALRFVDYVTTLPPSGTPTQNKQATYTVLAALRPDILVTPYRKWMQHASEFKKKYGTVVVLIRENRLNSTTSIMEKVRRSA